MTLTLICSLDYMPKTEEEDIVFTLAMVIIEIFMLVMRSQDFSANIIMISILGKGHSEDEQCQHDTCCRRGGYRCNTLLDEQSSMFVFFGIYKVLCLYFWDKQSPVCFFGMNKSPCLYFWDRQSSMCEFSDYNLNNDNHGYVDDVDDPRHD